jgi:hypothetical protein
MKIKAITLTLVLSLLVIVGIATASPNFQTQPFATNNFSAVFNGPVTETTIQHATNTDYEYYSASDGVQQQITVRFITHDISVDQTSADFYANDDAAGGSGSTGGIVTNRSIDTYQGHPFTYTRRHSFANGLDYAKRTRFIIVSAREVIFVTQVVPFQDLSTTAAGNGDQPQWIDFEDSLDIK